MKFNKILTVVLAGVSVLSAQSCLKDQADVFDSSSSERLQAYIEQTREILTSNEKGWIMEYYPGSGQSKGGYAYYLAFTARACCRSLRQRWTTPSLLSCLHRC